MNRPRLIAHAALTVVVTAATIGWCHCVLWLVTYGLHLLTGSPRMFWGSHAGLVIGAVSGLAFSAWIIYSVRSMARQMRGGNK